MGKVVCLKTKLCYRIYRTFTYLFFFLSVEKRHSEEIMSCCPDAAAADYVDCVLDDNDNDNNESVFELRRSQSSIKREIAFKYVPLASSASLTAFASTVMDPSVFAHFGDWSAAIRNSLWISSCAGVGVWIYDRPHLKQLSQKKRAFFALGLSSIFVQGSLLLCALANKMVGGNAMTHSAPRMILGASLAGGCIHLGKSYMDIVDGDYEEAAVEEDEVEEEGEE